jgi:membrane fusion protein
MSQEVTERRPLFRQEAVLFEQQGRQWGQVVPLQPMQTRIMVWFVMAAAAAIIVFLFLAQYARKETVPGYLAPAIGTARIYAPQPGTITAIHVEQGQRVEAGQPLLSISSSRIAASGDDVDATILDSLARQRDSLTRQIVAEGVRAGSERERLSAQIRSLETELVHLAAQVELQRERIAVVDRLVASARALSARGLVAEVEQRRREEALLEQRLGLSTLQQQVTARQSQLTETRFTLEQLPTATAERIQLLRNELSSAEQRIAETEGRRAYIIRAPIGGVVSSLQASVGQQADPQRLQLQILPGESLLQAELLIPARAIGFVEVGQDVRILYEAFPYQHFGTYRGRIARVSQTIVMGNDIAAPVTLREPAYRATVLLERPDVSAQGRLIPLQPDMLLRADIILERRRLMDWILNPLLSARLQG